MTVHGSEWPDARKRGRNKSPRGDVAHVSQLKRSSTDNRRDRHHHHYHSTAAACGYGRPGLNWLIQTSKVWQIVFSWNRIFTQILVLLPKCDDRTLDYKNCLTSLLRYRKSIFQPNIVILHSLHPSFPLPGSPRLGLIVRWFPKEVEKIVFFLNVCMCSLFVVVVVCFVSPT